MSAISSPTSSSLGAAAPVALPSPQQPAPTARVAGAATAAQAVLEALGAYLTAASWQSWAHKPAAEAAWTALARAWRRYEVERILAEQERRGISGEDV